MNEEIKKQIQSRLEKSLVDPELKNFFLSHLDELSDERANELLQLLVSEEEMIAKEIDRINSDIFRNLIDEMKTLSRKLTRKARQEIEQQDIQKEEEELETLEDQLNAM